MQNLIILDGENRDIDFLETYHRIVIVIMTIVHSGHNSNKMILPMFGIQRWKAFNSILCILN